jgi:methylase of polypeptide subunit release factors
LAENEERTIVEAGLYLYCGVGVLPPNNRVTRCLGKVVSAQRARSVLDMGCGSGVLALRASRYAEKVVGIDIDRRAIAAAQRNARKNRIRNVEFLYGNLYEPVAGRHFDLIVSNPPMYPIENQGVSLAVRGISSLCDDAGWTFLRGFLAGLSIHLTPKGRGMFVSSSLSDNVLIHSLVRQNRLCEEHILLRKGQCGSQDIYLWRIKRGAAI